MTHLVRAVRRRAASRAGTQAIALIDQAVLSGNTFVSTALIARFAGLDELGTFALVWMVVLLVNALQAAVVIAPMVSLAPADANRTAFLGHFIRAEWRLLAGLTALTVTVGALALVSGYASLSLLIASVAAILGYQTFDFARRFAYVCSRPGVSALGSFGTAVAQLGMLSAIGLMGGLNAAVALAVSATALIAAAFGMGSALMLDQGVGKFEPAVATRSWHSSRWLLGSALMQWVCGNLFLLVAPAFVGLTALGALRAAQSIVGVTNVWQQGLENIVPQATAQVWRNQGPRQAVRYVVRVTAIWTGITTLSTVVFLLSAEVLLAAIHGPEAVEFGWVLRAYAVLQLLTLLGLPLRSLLRAAEQTRGIFVGFAVAAMYSLVTVVPLLSAYGLVGVLIGLAGAQLAFQSALLFYVWKGLSTFERQATVRLSTT